MVRAGIACLKTRKACGGSFVSAKILKALESDELCTTLALLFDYVG